MLLRSWRRARLTVFAAALATSTIMYPVKAHAFIFSGTLGLIGGILAGAGIFTPLAGFGSAAIFTLGVNTGIFLSSTFGSLLLSVGIAAAQYLLTPKPKAPTVESARVNTRINEPPRWLHAGRSRVGGGAMFGEYDADGYFWYIIVHGDSELMSVSQVLFDEIPITIDAGTGEVTAPNDFRYKLVSSGAPLFQIWHRTYTPDDPVPPPLALFKSAFPEWTDDHKLAGTAYSIVRMSPISIEHRHYHYRFRGPFGLGEPSIAVIGEWSRVYDPRNEAHDIDDPMTWGTSRNSALIWAWFRTHPYGRRKPMSSINWTKVAEQADICDETVLDRYGNSSPRYVCGISIPDNKERHVAEAEILMTADAVILRDEEGKAYPHVGHYAAPTLTLSSDRDILAMQSRQAQDGETETDGVVVKYIEPDHLYVGATSAAWLNPNYYEEGTVPRLLTVEILACQNHRQAVTLAKAIGLRSQPPHRLAPTVGLRGLFAQQERIVDLLYDEDYTGAYEIVTPVEVDEAGIGAAFGAVPVDADRWTLLEGEEGEKPAQIVSIEYDDTVPAPAGVFVYGAPVPGSGGASVRIEATFAAPPRVDYRVEFQYKKSTDTAYRPMVVLPDDLLAYSDTVTDGIAYDVQARTVTLSGRASDWTPTPYSVTPVADTVAPGPVVSALATGGAGEITHAWTAPNSANYLGTRILTGTTNDINAATIFAVEYGAPNAPDTRGQPGLSAGTYYVWLIAINGSGVPAAAVATGPVTVT